MISGIKQQSTVGKNGKIEIPSTDLPEGTLVEIIVLVKSQPIDETDYLLSSLANKDRLIQALESVKDSDNLIVIKPNEWNFHPLTETQMVHKSLEALEEYRLTGNGMSHERVREWADNLGIDNAIA